MTRKRIIYPNKKKLSIMYPLSLELTFPRNFNTPYYIAI